MNIQQVFDELHSDDPAIVIRAIRILGVLREKSSVPALIEILQTGHEWEAIEAARALGKIGDTRAILPLQDVLLDNDRFMADMRTREITDSRELSGWEQLMLDAEDLRFTCLNALKQIGTRQAMEIFRVFSESESG